jgi:hypothetical protein
MSEGSAEGGGAPLSDGQFGETAQNPGDGIFSPGWYSWGVAQVGARRREDDRDLSRPRRRRKRKRSR